MAGMAGMAGPSVTKGGNDGGPSATKGGPSATKTAPGQAAEQVVDIGRSGHSVGTANYMYCWPL